MTKIRIGTRGSALALAQAYETRNLLCAAHGLIEDDFAIEIISTAGDRIQNRPLSEVGGKGLFSKEIEAALAANEIDLAVHSTKDMASVLPDGLGISAYLPREDVRDAFLSPVAKTIADLPKGAVIGSSSLRRQALLLSIRPDLEVVMFRGNVQTRLAKLKEGKVSATLLANAGLIRLRLQSEVTSLLEVEDFLPAPGQGAICLETRTDDAITNDLVAAINHPQTQITIETERAFLKALDGSCQTPIAGLAKLDGDLISFRGMILSEDGSQVFETANICAAKIDDAKALGTAAGKKLRQQAGDDFFHHWT